MIIDCGNNIPMCNHNIPMEIPHFNTKLQHTKGSCITSLSTVVLTSRDCQGKLWLPKTCPKITLKQYYNKNCLQMYWYNLTKAKNQFKNPIGFWKFLKHQLFVWQTEGLPAIKPTSSKCTGPILSITKALPSVT